MIGGNTTACIQLITGTVNAIGEAVPVLTDVQRLHGYLDLITGDSPYLNYNAKLQESTHVFICDYTPLDSRVTAENSRMLINGKRYDVLLIDNPMGLNKQLEILLRFTGE